VPAAHAGACAAWQRPVMPPVTLLLRLLTWEHAHR